MISAELQQRLRWIKVANPRLDLTRFPDVLIIGPQRTGTTWLHAHLRFHPQIQLSEPKEIFYFSRLKAPDDPKFQSNELEWYLRFFREKWWLRCAKLGLSLWRYRELYRPIVRGEATASYAALDEDVITEIVALKPDLKVITMIREPVDRAWSHAKKDLVRNRNRRFEEVGAAEFQHFFANPYQRQCAHYVQNCDRWAKHLRPGNLFVGLFDDVARRPHQLLLEVMRFLGVRSDRRYIAGDVGESVNPTTGSKIPPQHREFLERLFAEDLRQLQQRWGLAWPLPVERGGACRVKNEG